jgi:hypothetical protein
MEWMPLVKPDGEENRTNLESFTSAGLSSLDEADLVFGEKVIGLSYFREI